MDALQIITDSGIISFILQMFIIVFGGILGGVFYRWRGGGEATSVNRFTPRPVEQMLFCIPYFLISYVSLEPWIAFIVSVITLIMVLRGHGDNMDLGRGDATREKNLEWYESLIYPLYDKLSNYWYDALGLVVSGVSYTLPLGLFIAAPGGGFFWEGLALAASGALKAPAYMIGLWYHDKFILNSLDQHYGSYTKDEVVNFDTATSYGEFLTGVFLWVPAIWIYLIYIGR